MAERWGPNYLQIGLASSDDFEGDTTQRFQGQHQPGLKTFPGGARSRVPRKSPSQPPSCG